MGGKLQQKISERWKYGMESLPLHKGAFSPVILRELSDRRIFPKRSFACGSG